MKPGASVRPAASTTSSPAAGAVPPTSTIRSPAIRTFALRPADPVPSRTVALMMTDAPVAGGVPSPADARAGGSEDRESGGEGKSVELGGRRSIKKKKKKRTK